VELRPIRHYANRRVLGHVSVCVPALLIERMMDLALAQAKIVFFVFVCIVNRLKKYMLFRYFALYIIPIVISYWFPVTYSTSGNT
jgi:hypothetical protein